MRASTSSLVWVLLIIVGPFVIVPFFGSWSVAGKLYFLALWVPVAFLAFLHNRSTLKFSPVHGVLVVFWGFFLISFPLALYPPQALLAVAALGLFLLLSLLVTQLSSEGNWFGDRLVDGLLVLGVTAAVLGLYEHQSYLLLGSSRGMLIPYVLPPNVSIRVGGPLGQPNLFALLLVLCLLAFFFRYIHRPADQGSALPGWLRLVPVTLVAVVFFLTGSRAGLLSFLLTFGVLSWMVAGGRYLAVNRFGRREFLLLVLALAAGFLLSKWAHLIGWGERGGHGGGNVFLQHGLGTAAIGSEIRFVLWLSALLIFGDHPWSGVGLDNFKFILPAYQPNAHELLGFVQYEAMTYTNWAHNELLQILAEGGILPFLLALGLLLLVFRSFFRRCVRRGTGYDGFLLYSHLFLFPFIIQALFSWPLREPGLMTLFFASIGLLLAQGRLRSLALSTMGRGLLRVSMVAVLIVVGFLCVQEVRVGTFYKNLKNAAEPVETLEEFRQICQNPYGEFRVLKKALPVYKKFAFQQKDESVAGQLLPYSEKLVELQGAYWQWYDLAVLYHLAGHSEKAGRAVAEAIRLQPAHQPSWFFQHWLNMEEAARATGRPLEEFIPKAPEGRSFLSEFSNARNRAAKNK